MDSRLEKIVQVLQEQASATFEEFRGELHIFLDASRIVDALSFLRDGHEFSLLSALTAVDYWPQDHPRFHVVYQLTSLTQNLSVQLRVPLNSQEPRVPTVTGVFATANWREREISDMFGIEVEGHPLRKDYPLGYEEPQFSFNFDEIDVRKPHAGEKPPAGGSISHAAD